jgi:hypothetical protein
VASHFRPVGDVEVGKVCDSFGITGIAAAGVAAKIDQVLRFHHSLIGGRFETKSL